MHVYIVSNGSPVSKAKQEAYSLQKPEVWFLIEEQTMHYGKMTSLLFSQCLWLPWPLYPFGFFVYTLFAPLQSASYTLLDALYIATLLSCMYARCEACILHVVGNRSPVSRSINRAKQEAYSLQKPEVWFLIEEQTMHYGKTSLPLSRLLKSQSPCMQSNSSA
jgi:hypothetical protein